MFRKDLNGNSERKLYPHASHMTHMSVTWHTCQSHDSHASHMTRMPVTWRTCQSH